MVTQPPLYWKRGGRGHEAYLGENGRLLFAVVKGPKKLRYLYTYGTKIGGQVVFKSKEIVDSVKGGKRYAEELWRLQNAPEQHRRDQKSQSQPA